jgi:hypothetical protein
VAQCYEDVLLTVETKLDECYPKIHEADGIVNKTNIGKIIEYLEEAYDLELEDLPERFEYEVNQYDPEDVIDLEDMSKDAI